MNVSSGGVTSGGAIRFAPGPGLPQAEALPDVGKEVVDDAAVILRRRDPFPDCNQKGRAEVLKRNFWVWMILTFGLKGNSHFGKPGPFLSAFI